MMRTDHVQLAFPAGGLDKMRQFFVSVMGMLEEERPPSLQKREGAWFRKDTCIIHIGVDPNFQPQKKAHIAIIVSDIEDFARNIGEHGYEVYWEDSIESVKRFFTEDPFGNRLEFIRDGDGNVQKLKDNF